MAQVSPPAPPPPRWHPRWDGEPYRVLFPVGMLGGVLGLGLWAAGLAGLPVPSLAPAAHGQLMLFGVFGAAVLGFLGTAFPRQTGAKAWGLPATLALAGAQVAVMAGAVLGGLAQDVGMAVGAVAWGLVGAWAARIAVPALRKDWHSTTAAAPIAVASVGAAMALAAMGRAPRLVPALAIHAGLVPLALVLLDRVLPFFSRKKHPEHTFLRRPAFGLPLVAMGLLRALAEGLDAAPMVATLADVGWLLLVLRQWAGWKPWLGWRPPLLGVLHLGIAWLVVATALDALRPTLGLDPGALRHLWTVGGLATLVLGISVRVSRGHGGVPLRLGWDGIAMILLVQVAVVARGVLALLGVQPAWAWPLAGCALGGAMAFWLVRMLPLMRPR
jgi:uncharacterized protein involved in response to NO